MKLKPAPPPAPPLVPKPPPPAPAPFGVVATVGVDHTRVNRESRFVARNLIRLRAGIRITSHAAASSWRSACATVRKLYRFAFVMACDQDSIRCNSCGVPGLTGRPGAREAPLEIEHAHLLRLDGNARPAREDAPLRCQKLVAAFLAEIAIRTDLWRFREYVNCSTTVN